MARLRDVLGINARSAEFLHLNSKRARRIADDKLLTKRILAKNKIDHPNLIRSFREVSKLYKFAWSKREKGFVVKPASGLGGQGVLVVKKYLSDKKKMVGSWWKTDFDRGYSTSCG
jgi:glutathione synthase/RimK-type ligase-like ATP-grasp enzyme